MLAIVHLLGTYLAISSSRSAGLKPRTCFSSSAQHRLEATTPRLRLRGRALLVWKTRLWSSLLGLASMWTTKSIACSAVWSQVAERTGRSIAYCRFVLSDGDAVQSTLARARRCIASIGLRVIGSCVCGLTNERVDRSRVLYNENETA